MSTTTETKTSVTEQRGQGEAAASPSAASPSSPEIVIEPVQQPKVSHGASSWAYDLPNQFRGSSTMFEQLFLKDLYKDSFDDTVMPRESLPTYKPTAADMAVWKSKSMDSVWDSFRAADMDIWKSSSLKYDKVVSMKKALTRAQKKTTRSRLKKKGRAAALS